MGLVEILLIINVALYLIDIWIVDKYQYRWLSQGGNGYKYNNLALSILLFLSLTTLILIVLCLV